MTKMTRGHVAEIDFLRAISVLVVFICHLEIGLLKGGFIGVDVFFVISGYVVTLSLVNRSFKGFADLIFGFYARRFLRIFPALISCVLVTAVMTAIFVPQSWLSHAVQTTGQYALFGFSNMALIWFDDGYFSPRSDFNPFTHTWSLGVEEQFYLIFPVLFVLLIGPWVLRNKRPILGISVLILAALVSLAYSWHLGGNDPRGAYYLLASRWWELAAGVVLAMVHTSYPGSRPNEAFRAVYAAVGLVAIGVAAVFADAAHFPFPWALLPVAGAMVFLHGVTGPAPVSGMVGRVLQTPVMSYIGRVSYSLYLWHWPVIVLFRWTIGIEGQGEIALAIVLSFVAASASYHFLETPIRNIGHRKIRFLNYAVVTAGVACIFVSMSAYSMVFDKQHRLSLSVTADKHAWYPYAFDRESDYTGPKFEGRTIFAIGDSHLGAYEAMLHWTAQDLGVELKTRGIDDCQLGRLFYPINRSDHCQWLIEDIMTSVESQAKPGDIVFFPTLRGHRLVDQWIQFDMEHVRQFNLGSGFIDNLAQNIETNVPYFKRLADKGLIVLLDLPKPTMPTVPYRCSDWFNTMNPICSNGDSVPRDIMEELRGPMVSALEEVARRVPEVRLWDPFPYLCPGEACAVRDAEGPLFFDGDHISGHGNQVLLPAFRETVTALFEQST